MRTAITMKIFAVVLDFSARTQEITPYTYLRINTLRQPYHDVGNPMVSPNGISILDLNDIHRMRDHLLSTSAYHFRITEILTVTFGRLRHRKVFTYFAAAIGFNISPFDSLT
jgi:hypothetical protein